MLRPFVKFTQTTQRKHPLPSASYLTGFRASETSPFLKAGLSAEGVKVLGAKRNKGEAPVWKLRQWSPRLRCVVARAPGRKDAARRIFLFAPSKRPLCCTRSGWDAYGFTAHANPATTITTGAG